MPKVILYKFRDWSNDNHKKSLTHQNVYFASPSQFNDPFDCAINYRYDKLSELEKLEKYIEQIKDEHPLKHNEEIILEANQWMKEGLLETDAILENNQKLIRASVNSNVGILSLTKTKDPILLWSHYSNDHKGYCIGYDIDVLRSDFLAKYGNPQKVFYEINVNYSNDYPEIIPRKDITTKEYISIPISTKSIVWSYEQEYRIFILGATRELTQVPPEAIIEVTMGCKMEDKDQIAIGEYVIKNLPHTALYLAKMHHESFELVFQRMN